MSRSGYIDDCENLGLWRGAVMQATYGKRGQTFLKELAKAMDAMPVKRLIAGELVTSSGECCAIGAVCLSRNLDVSAIYHEDPSEVGEAVGIAHALAAEIEYMNDEWEHGETPEQRWQRMREWVDKRILKEDE